MVGAWIVNRRVDVLPRSSSSFLVTTFRKTWNSREIGDDTGGPWNHSLTYNLLEPASCHREYSSAPLVERPFCSHVFRECSSRYTHKYSTVRTSYWKTKALPPLTGFKKKDRQRPKRKNQVTMATTTTSADCVTSSTTTSFLEYVSALENRLATRSDDLEEKHMEAAIDAQLIDTSQQSNSNPLLLSTPQPQPGSTGPTTSTHPPLFDDYTNPNAVPNCLSPYVPAQAVRIAALPRFAKLEASDVLLDLGCGDGRVCVAMSKLTGCRAVGVDLSPLCIRLATDLAWEEQGDGVDCTFFQADATLDPTQLLHGTLRQSRLAGRRCTSSLTTSHYRK